MRKPLLRTFAVVVALGAAGCSASGGSTTDPGGDGTAGAGGDLGVAGASGSGSSGDTGTSGSAGSGGTAGDAGSGAAGAAGGGVAGDGGAAGASGSGMAGSGSGGAAGTGGAGAAGASGGGAAGTAGAGGKAGSAGAGGGGTGGGGTGGGGTGGVAGSGGSGSVTKFVGNITTDNGANTGGLTYSKYWNQITPENAGKWGSVQQSATSGMNWGTLDAIYDYATKNNVIFKEHTFIWGSQQPSGNITQTNVQNWMNAFCSRYPETKVIDVVNEPPPHTTPAYANNIGGGTNGNWQWIANAFIWARAACKTQVLIMNDYNNIEYGNQEDHFISIVKAIQTLGAPIDAVGAQSHDVALKANLSNTQLTTNLTKMNTQTGLPLYITEYDVSTTDDTQQLNVYKSQFPLLMSTDFIHGITIWGWIYGKTWSQAPNSGLVRNGQPRPAMTWLMQQLGRPVPPN